jgi:hypothetical protein
MSEGDTSMYRSLDALNKSIEKGIQSMRREPPDPLRHSFSMNLDQTPAEVAEFERLDRRRKDAEQCACMAMGAEQIETASREQDEAHAALEDYWRHLAARQVDGADQELRDYLDWVASGGKRHSVTVELGSAADLPDLSDQDQDGEHWKRRR